MADAKYIKPKRQRRPNPNNVMAVANTANELAA
jgi:hypothetical protein